jgi:hypothetical protein
MQSGSTQISLVSLLADEPERSFDRKIPNREILGDAFTVMSDASETHIAAFSLDRKENFVYIQELSALEKTWSSSSRELCAIQHALEEVSFMLDTPMTFFWITDNANVEKFLRKGSGDPEILEQAIHVLQLAKDQNIEVVPVWVRRADHRLQKADALSKLRNTDDWSISWENYYSIVDTFGLFNFDLFATSANAKCPGFYTYNYDALSSGVDAFVLPWSGLGHLFVAPPVISLHKVISHLAKEEKVSGVLLIPLWKGARFWLSAFPDGSHAAVIFKGIYVMPCSVSMWDMNPKNVLGSFMNLLILPFVSGGGVDLLSNVVPENCIRRLFNMDCVCLYIICFFSKLLPFYVFDRIQLNLC